MPADTLDKTKVFSLLQEHKDRIRGYGVLQLGLFGSFVRNEQQRDSDIDLLVEFGAGQKNFDNFIHLAFFLDDLFGRPVELLTPESISPYLRRYIMEEIEYVSFRSLNIYAKF